jgi:hypothetical protein
MLTVTESLTEKTAKTWEFYYLRRTSPSQSWAQASRESWVAEGFTDYSAARAMFWFDEDPELVYLCGAVRGDRMEADASRFTLAGSDWTAEELDYLLVEVEDWKAADLLWFTIFGAWNNGDGLRPFVESVQAPDFVRAEHLVRAQCRPGTFYVAAVLFGDHTSEEGDEYLHGTSDGQEPGAQAGGDNTLVPVGLWVNCGVVLCLVGLIVLVISLVIRSFWLGVAGGSIGIVGLAGFFFGLIESSTNENDE